VFGLVLNLFPASKAREIISGYADLAAPGSLLAVSCIRVDDTRLREELGAAFTPRAGLRPHPGRDRRFPRQARAHRPGARGCPRLARRNARPAPEPGSTRLRARGCPAQEAIRG